MSVYHHPEMGFLAVLPPTLPRGALHRTGISRLLQQCQGKMFPAWGRVPGSLPAPGGVGVPRPPAVGWSRAQPLSARPPHERGSGANTKQRRLPLQSLVSGPQQDLAEPPPLPHPFPREMLLKRRNAGTKELTRHTPLPLPAWGNSCWLFPEPPPPEARVSPGCWR